MGVFGGIEAGGTKFNCIVGSGPDHILAEARISTGMPDQTLGEVVEFFEQWQITSGIDLDALGIACFGPVDLHPESATYGHITSTPKPHWPNTDMVGAFVRHFGIPVGFDTDVNGAGLAEYAWGAGRGLDVFVYLTVGTGIGGGVIIDGSPLHGLLHTEMGHIRIPHDTAADPFIGACPYHGDCFQGLASGRAMNERWQVRAETLAPEHPAWELEAHYLALGVCTMVCMLSPRRIVLGGGVMSQPRLLSTVQRKTHEYMNDYLNVPELLERLDEFLVLPELGDRAGRLGALILAERAQRQAGGPEPG